MNNSHCKLWFSFYLFIFLMRILLLKFALHLKTRQYFCCFTCIGFQPIHFRFVCYILRYVIVTLFVAVLKPNGFSIFLNNSLHPWSFILLFQTIKSQPNLLVFLFYRHLSIIRQTDLICSFARSSLSYSLRPTDRWQFI